MSDAVIDTCCLINVYAAGDMAGVLTHTGLTWHVPPAVAAEAVFVRARDAEGRMVKRRVDLAPFLAAGVLLGAALAEGEETAMYVDLAADLADGEAMALAIACHRGWLLATDDRKVRRRAAELQTKVITTPQILRRWAAGSGAAPAAIRAALLNVRQFASFVPSADSPEWDWWNGCLTAGP